MSLLDVRLEEERHLARLGVTGCGHCIEAGEPSSRKLTPICTDPCDERFAEGLVAQDHSGVEEPERALQVLGCHCDGFPHRPHAVIELESRVPERIPEPLRNDVDVESLVMEKKDVQVATGAELLTPVPTDSEHREAVALLDEPS